MMKSFCFGLTNYQLNLLRRNTAENYNPELIETDLNQQPEILSSALAAQIKNDDNIDIPMIFCEEKIQELQDLSRDMKIKMEHLATLYNKLGISNLKQRTAYDLNGLPIKISELTEEEKFYYKIKDVFDELQTTDLFSADSDSLRVLSEKVKSAIKKLDDELKKREADIVAQMKNIYKMKGFYNKSIPMSLYVLGMHNKI